MQKYKDVNCTETALLFLFLMNPSSLYYEISTACKLLGSKIKIWPRYAQEPVYETKMVQSKKTCP